MNTILRAYASVSRRCDTGRACRQPDTDRAAVARRPLVSWQRTADAATGATLRDGEHEKRVAETALGDDGSAEVKAALLFSGCRTA